MSWFSETCFIGSNQVTVSSGGMLTQKLNVDDLQFEKGTFDGTMAYAQNKVKPADVLQLNSSVQDRAAFCWPVFVLSSTQRQQVILTERWASQHKDINFSCMHPGWADTPGEDEQEQHQVWSKLFSLLLD